MKKRFLVYLVIAPLFLLSSCGGGGSSSSSKSNTSTSSSSKVSSSSISQSSASSSSLLVSSTSEIQYSMRLLSTSGSMARNSDSARASFSDFKVDAFSSGGGLYYPQFSFTFTLLYSDSVDDRGYTTSIISTEIVLRGENSGQKEIWCDSGKMQVNDSCTMTFAPSLVADAWTAEAGNYFG